MNAINRQSVQSALAILMALAIPGCGIGLSCGTDTPSDAQPPGNASANAAAETATLTVRVTGLRNRRGHVLVGVFDKPEEFPANAARSAFSEKTAIEGETVTVRFDGLPPGRWAVGALHDENGNLRLDTNVFGAPLEGYGASNNPPVRRGPPGFDESAFDLEPGDTSIVIELRYLF